MDLSNPMCQSCPLLSRDCPCISFLRQEKQKHLEAAKEALKNGKGDTIRLKFKQLGK